MGHEYRLDGALSTLFADDVDFVTKMRLTQEGPGNRSRHNFRGQAGRGWVSNW